MTKKKNDYTSLTLTEYEEFLRLHIKVRDIASALGRLMLEAQDEYMSGIETYASDGVYVYIEEREYDEIHKTYLVPLDALLHPQPFEDKLEKEAIEREKEQEVATEKWERAQYEKLKAKFEGELNG